MDPRNLENARDFLKLRRIALVGMSHDEKEFSRYVFRELARRGIDVVPVNPGLQEAEGRPCYGRLQDVKPAVDGALIMIHPEKVERILRDCLEAGVRRVWFHRGAGRGSGDASALAFCASHGIEVVRDLCPFMALPNAGAGHAVHGWFRRTFG